MSFKKTNNYGIGDNNFTAFQETLDTTRRGLVEMSLSNYDTDAAPVVKVGSWFENNGSMFEVVTGDETPSGYGGIANSVTFYLYYSVSGDEFIYDSTTPVWNDALQGYYNSNDRALFSMYKDSGGTLYQFKNKFDRRIRFYYSTGPVTNGTIRAELLGWVPNAGDYLTVDGQMDDPAITINLQGVKVLGIFNNGSGTVNIQYIKTSSNAILNRVFASGSDASTLIQSLELKSEFAAVAYS